VDSSYQFAVPRKGPVMNRAARRASRCQLALEGRVEVDPTEELAVVFMTQLMSSSSFPLRTQLRQLVYSALVDRVDTHKVTLLANHFSLRQVQGAVGNSHRQSRIKRLVFAAISLHILDAFM